MEATSRSAPVRAADVILAAAVRGRADTAYIEPVPLAEDTLMVTIERASQVLASATVDATLGAATIARLGFLARLDLTSANTVTGVIPVKTRDREADVVVTIRGGTTGLRAEMLIVTRGQATAKPAKPPAPVDLRDGDVVDRYKIIERLGQGGMGAVYRVEHTALGREHALKVLRGSMFENDNTAAARFLREARAASRIRHPSIVDVYDFGHLADGRPYFVMELLSGKSLADLIDADDLEPPRVVALAKQLAEALAAAHERGVIHADITPSNALVVDDGGVPRLKLVDFGLAELVGEELARDDTGFIFGTPHYVSPEQIRGLPATERTDQYGLGAVVFEMLSGRPPFLDDDLRALCMKHIQAPIPEPISKYGPLPAKLVDIVVTCLQKSPSSRFPSMRALIVALDEVEHVIDRRGWRRWLPR
jgi:tRNA A-37 threonylcarbamoyl transferase component Bud32